MANLLGPADRSVDDAAVAIGRGRETPVTPVHLPEAHASQASVICVGGCMSAWLLWTVGYLRHHCGGLRQTPEGRTVESTTPTPMEQFTRQVSTLMMGSASGASSFVEQASISGGRGITGFGVRV